MEGRVLQKPGCEAEEQECGPRKGRDCHVILGHDGQDWGAWSPASGAGLPGPSEKPVCFREVTRRTTQT